MVSEVFEKLVNNRIFDDAEKSSLFSDFQYGFRSSLSTVDLLTIVSDRIARAFNRSGATQAAALDIFKAFDRLWYAGLLHKLKSCGISGHMFGLDSFARFLMESLQKNIQLMLEFLKAPLLFLHFSYCKFMTFPVMLSVIFIAAVYAKDTTPL